MQLRRLAATTALALTVATSLAACGNSDPNPTTAKTEGVYVTAGDLKYQVQISRQLNPASFEDRDYLTGLPPGFTVGPDEAYFGVFVRVFNQTDAPHQSARRFIITDTTGKVFPAVPLNLNINRVAYRPLVVNGGDQIPVPGSLARENSTQGGLILFKVPNASFANRPLVLHIASPTGGQGATVDLDV